MIERTNSRCSSNRNRTLKNCYPSARAPKKSIRLPRFKKAWKAFAYLCLCTSTAYSQEIEYRSLPELIEQGSKALVRGEFHSAAQAFNSIRSNYVEEPIWLEGQLPAKILPLAGFASHKANLQSEAIASLESYLADYSEEQSSEVFARYTLASSLLLDGQTKAAREAFSELRSLAGDSPFRDLASLREAQLSDTPRAVEILKRIVADPASPRLATFARLRLIQLYLEQEDLNNASIQLLDTPWPQASMPELATLSFLASQIGDMLITQQPANALQAYRLVSPKYRLIQAQQNRIEELKKRYRQLSPNIRTEQSMWSDQFRQSIKMLQSQLENLRNTPSYSQSIDLRKARCFARINRPLEAWILLKPIATSSSSLARDAHIEWISVARSMTAWNAAASIATDFISKYPDDKDIPQVLFWIALSQIEQKDFSLAISSLNSVIEKDPTRQITAAAYYYLGFCQFNLGHTPSAIAAFEQCQATNPQTPVASQAILWVGICHFTTNKLEKAITTFQEIQQAPHAQFLHPEAAFRETACHYALGELDRALTQSKTWLDKHPLHARTAEVYLLQGDILAEQNELSAAIQAYAQVESNDTETQFIAIEKRCSLLIETERTEEALNVLESYRSQAPVSPKFIGAFTTLITPCLSEDDAQKEISNVISDYGNDLSSTGLISLIRQIETPLEAKEDQPTLESRLLVASIQTHRQSGNTTHAKLKALELASNFDIEALPPSALIEAGRALSEISSLDAPNYLNTLLKQYPNSRYTNDAYIELAKYHAQRNAPEIALAHLLQANTYHPETLALKLELEIELKQLNNAQSTAEQILSERHAAPVHKAQALKILGDIHLEAGSNNKAYSYYQRIFTLYRGETKYVAHAYQACIQILNSDNRPSDALKVTEEFLAQTDLENDPAYQTTKNRNGIPVNPYDPNLPK